MNRIKVFICYSSKNSNEAIELKKVLSDCYGFSVFLAEDSIRISEHSKNEILLNLSCCEIFVPIVSKKLKKSSFANQEIGFAIARKRRIAPISVDTQDSYDLFYERQARKCLDLNPYAILKAATEIYLVTISLKEFAPLRDRAIANLVTVFSNSSHFRITSACFFVMKNPKATIRFSPSQLTQIKSALHRNPEIYKWYKFAEIQSYFATKYKIH